MDFLNVTCVLDNGQTSNSTDLPEENGPDDFVGQAHSERSRRVTSWPSGSRNNSLPTQTESHEEEESKYYTYKKFWLILVINLILQKVSKKKLNA